MKHERRSIKIAEVRVDEAKPGTFEAVVLRYNVVDDYNTRFRPGVFTESLAARLPRIVWAHRWDDPIGRYVDYRDTPTELTLIGELDDFDAVPRARQAYAQLKSGTIDQFSVGFERLADEAVDPALVDGMRGVVDIVKGTLEEASLVLLGAVPGTHLVGVRSAAGTVDVDAVVELAKRIAAGEITEAEGKAALVLLATDDDTGDGDDDDVVVPPEPTPEEVAAVEAAAADLADAEAEADGADLLVGRSR